MGKQVRGPSVPRWPLVLGIILISLPLLTGLATLFTDIEECELSGDGVPIIPGTPRIIELGSFHSGDIIRLHFKAGSPLDVCLDTLANCQAYRDTYTYSGSVGVTEPDLTNSSSGELDITVPREGSYAVLFDNKGISATTVSYHITYPPKNLTRLLIWGGISLIAGTGLIGIYVFFRQRIRKSQAGSEGSTSSIEHVIIEGKNDDDMDIDRHRRSGRAHGRAGRTGGRKR